jgi:hypothetical protein
MCVLKLISRELLLKVNPENAANDIMSNVGTIMIFFISDSRGPIEVDAVFRRAITVVGILVTVN